MATSSTWTAPVALRVTPPPTDTPPPRPVLARPRPDDLVELPPEASGEFTIASEPAFPESLAAPAVSGRPWGRWTLTLGGLLLLGVWVQEWLVFLLEQWRANRFWGGFFMLATAAGLGTGLAWAGREWSRWRSLNRTLTLAADVARLGREGDPDALWAILQPLATRHETRPESANGAAAFFRQVDDTLNSEQLLELFSREILGPLDQRALKIVLHHTGTVALTTAVSPFALVDGLLFAWRTLRMVREVADCYGCRPGTVGVLRLMSHGVTGFLAAGGTELLTGQAQEALGGSVASLFLARAGQGLASGLFTARLGLQTIHLCRPVPLHEGETMGWGRLRKEVLESMGELLRR
ncbi:MAG: DUF697 domain-containing protein [Magnetococcales bacterium]|nr:DUF697 domain-containing protein [Magnetococcales bacterium]